MPLVDIHDDTKGLMDSYRDLIKGDYITYKLFLDSAVRQRLRSMGAEVGEDLIIPHLKRLEQSKQRHLERQSVAQTRLRHQRRINIARKRLDSIK
jgi:hypothetical protein